MELTHSEKVCLLNHLTAPSMSHKQDAVDTLSIAMKCGLDDVYLAASDDDGDPLDVNDPNATCWALTTTERASAELVYN